jgi:penicillin amidase
MQIRDRLRALEGATERDLLAVQLDDRALFLSRWRELLLRALTAEALAGHPERGDFRAFVSVWGDRARPDSVGYRLVRAFRSKLADQLMSALTAPARARDPKFEWNRLGQWEGPVWALVTERPAHLLPLGSPSWDAQLLAAVDAVIADLRPLGPLRERTWGEQNAALFLHPLSPALPRWLRRHVDLPPRPLAGDANVPRVLAPRHGASERMVVSPARRLGGGHTDPVPAGAGRAHARAGAGSGRAPALRPTSVARFAPPSARQLGRWAAGEKSRLSRHALSLLRGGRGERTFTP